MKLLHISPSYYPAFKFGGPIQSVHLINKALVKKGIKVDVLTTNAGLSQEQRKKIKEKSEKNNVWLDPSLLDDSNKAETSGVRVKYLDFVGYEHYNFSLQMVKEIWKIIDDYHLVHITAVWNFPVLAGSLISSIKKKPYIISPRGVFHQEALTSKSGFIKKIYFNLFAKHYLNKADAIHYTSNIEKEETEQIFKHKNSFVIPNGIDISSIAQSAPINRYFHPAYRPGRLVPTERKAALNYKKYLLILGRIDRIKGFDILIPAFASVAAKFNDLKLVIAGDASVAYASEVRKMVEAQKISNKVIFTGHVVGDDKWSLYKNALMFVLPSYSENFGMSVVEAMSCGCPVVISDKVGIYKEVLENNAGIIVATNKKSTADGISKLLNDEKLRKQIAINGKTMVEKYYDICKVAEQFINVYERIKIKG